MLGSWTVFNILREAGLPDGVLNFAPGRGADVGSTLIQHPDMAGLHFTGGTRYSCVRCGPVQHVHV